MRKQIKVLVSLFIFLASTYVSHQWLSEVDGKRIVPNEQDLLKEHHSVQAEWFDDTRQTETETMSTASVLSPALQKTNQQELQSEFLSIAIPKKLEYMRTTLEEFNELLRTEKITIVQNVDKTILRVPLGDFFNENDSEEEDEILLKTQLTEHFYHLMNEIAVTQAIHEIVLIDHINNRQKKIDQEKALAAHRYVYNEYRKSAERVTFQTVIENDINKNGSNLTLEILFSAKFQENQSALIRDNILGKEI
ncbi:MAG: hypothetical protein H6623_00275 [Bdellovibrionaceae bacterium]|nr:hypothetical protein [Pseudobdellovibrionaceae bacterium]